jgi:anti-repressor protein
MSQKLKENQNKIKIKSKYIHMLKSHFSIQKAAKLTGFPGGEIKFFNWLRTQNYLLANNEPFQRYIDKGWFVMKLKKIKRANQQLVVPVTLVTLKGVLELQKIIHKKFPPCLPCNRNNLNKI